jgi:hypothetical protein
MARWAARSRNAAINLGAYQFCSGVVRASAQLVQDAAFPIESWLARQFAERFGRNFENVFTNGSGNNDEEAVKLANDSPYGLGGSFITKDIELGKRIAYQIDTGMVFINQTTWTAPDLPFGGVKNSGYGRELSDLGIGEFVNRKLIRVA